MTFCKDVERKLLDMLFSGNQVDGVGGGSATGELHGGDVVFYSPDKPIASGGVVLAQSPNDEQPHYYRVFPDVETVLLTHVDNFDKHGAFPLAEVKIFGTVTGIYREIFPREAPQFDEKEKNLFDRLSRAMIETVPSAYWPPLWEENAIYRLTKLSPYDGLMRFFAYGFVKGVRAEKKRVKKARAKKIEGGDKN